jgi:erythromycin esterase-like protein
MFSGMSKQREVLSSAAAPIDAEPAALEPVLDLIGDAAVVLLGEATHGTHEFYHLRGELTARLIEERGFDAVAVEADWPDAYRVNRYVRGIGDDNNPEEALDDFQRFPRWMWRNAVMPPFLERLRQINDSRQPREQVGFYGLDLYSLYRSVALEPLDLTPQWDRQRLPETYPYGV